MRAFYANENARIFSENARILLKMRENARIFPKMQENARILRKTLPSRVTFISKLLDRCNGLWTST